MRQSCAGTVLIVLLLLSGCGQTTTPTAATAEQLGPVQITGASLDELGKTIVLPRDEPPFPDGPGVEDFRAACAICHSTRYISMQPLFPRAVWTAEVQKMAKIYGAMIPEDRSSRIVEYLVDYQEKSRNRSQ